MVFEIGLLLVTFIGSKVYDSLKASQQQKVLPDSIPISTQDPELDPLNEIEKQQIRDLRMAGVSMVLFACKNFIPGAVPLGLATYLYSSVPNIKNVERSLLLDKKVNVDVLFFIADVLTLGMKNYFTAALGLYMIHAGKYSMSRAKDDSAKMVTHLFKELPQTVWVLYDEVEIEIPLDQIKADDLLVINSGGVIPVDGVIEQGAAQIDQQALTGEAQPAEKVAGDRVFANTIVMAGKVVIRVNCSGADTTSAQIAEILSQSVSFKSTTQLKGEKWANQMTLPMFLSSIAIFPFIGATSTAVFINSHIGIRIQFYAPITTLNHIAEASKAGILVKDGRALEQLSTVDTILFDKTGTLTTDQPEVTKVIATGKYSPTELLAYAATAEQKLAHPIARAILDKAEEQELCLFAVEDSSYQFGYGIKVTVNQKLIRVGSVRFFQQECININQDVIKEQSLAHAAGNTFIVVGIDRDIAGFIELKPQIRPEIKEIIAQLRGYGIDHMGIISGDHLAPTSKLAQELGMDEYFYDVLPENKARIVEDLQAQGRVVCFIGDGINDSIALKKANVSMSIVGATAIAKDMAEVVFMDGTLKNLLVLVELSKRLDINLKRSLKLCLVPSAANIVGTFFLNFSVLMAMSINMGTGFVSVSNILATRKKVLPDPDKVNLHSSTTVSGLLPSTPCAAPTPNPD